MRDRFELALELRVGIACGTVAAGIVGKQRYSLELCGEGLDRAEALQASARPGTIAVDERIRARARAARFIPEMDGRCFVVVP